MCSNYRPVTRLDRMLAFFGVELREDQPTPPEVWPLNLAPFIRRAEDGSGNRLVDGALFGLLPHFAKEIAYGRRTYNARSETVATLPSFRHAWGAGQRCIIPAECIFEPCYESGKAVRWAIQRPGQVPMAIAGIYRRWKAPDGKWLWTMAMLTVNADGHPVFKRMHKPTDEKRMVLLLDENQYDAWLDCKVEDAPAFFKQWHGPLDTFASPLPPRGRGNSKAPPPRDQSTSAGGNEAA